MIVFPMLKYILNQTNIDVKLFFYFIQPTPTILDKNPKTKVSGRGRKYLTKTVQYQKRYWELFKGTGTQLSL